MKSSSILLLLLLLVLLLLPGCGGGGGGSSSSGSQTTVKLVSIAVTPTNPSIPLGTTEQFTATGTYSDNSTQNITTSVIWSSSAPSVATVSNAAGSIGQAVPAAVGSTTITATSGSISGSTILTVTSATLVSITVTPANPSISLVAATEQFTATGTYSDNSTQNITTSVIWSSSAPSVATVSNAAGSIGQAVPAAVGSTTITATSGSISGSTILTVTSATLVSITVTPINSSIAVGTNEQFTAIGTYSNNSTQNITTSVTWSSSNPSVATISSSGNATAVAAGIATITATYGRSIAGSAALTVNPPTLVSIAVTAASSSIAVGATDQFTATGTYSNNSTQNITTSVTWSSSNPSVATISSSGNATAVAAGTTTITAASGSISGSTGLTVTGGGGGNGNNVLSLTVNGSTCDPTTNPYINQPCVSVTVCSTSGASNCETINGILLDTGSFGLRIFKQKLGSVSLTQVASGSGSLAEVVEYADGSSDWGPVQLANVILGHESAVEVPIQVIDSTFAGVTSFPSNPAVGQLCNRTDFGNLYYWTGSTWSKLATPDTTPSGTGFNGILGVGPFVQDCGSTCANFSNNGMYYTCTGSKCTGTTVPLSNQASNPVALTADSNGLIVQLPSVAAGGAPSVTGSLVLGIGTESNNSPSGVITYTLDSSGDFVTTFNSITYTSFIDTGSNGLFFPSPSRTQLPNCPDGNSSWFCPTSTTSFSATIEGASGSPSNSISFQIGNFINLVSSSNMVFSDSGGTFTGAFDWGLPFYFNRNVFIGFEGKTSSLGTGPYFAY